MKRCNEHALAQTGHAWAPKNWGWDPPTLRKAKGWQGLLSLVKQKFFGSTRTWSQVSSVSEHLFYFYFSFCTQPPRFIKLLITCYRLELQLMAEMLLVQFVFNHISMTVFVLWSLQQLHGSVWCQQALSRAQPWARCSAKSRNSHGTCPPVQHVWHH